MTSYPRSRRIAGALAISTAVLSQGCGGSSSGTRDPVAWPEQTLAQVAATTVDATQFLPVAQIKAWQTDLDQRGLRATGSAAHEKYIDDLYVRLQGAGVGQLHFENATFTRWSVDSWSLDVVGGSTPGAVTAAAYIPYSGATTADGITAPMAYLPAGTAPNASMAGKIVVVDIASLPTTAAAVLATAISTYDPNGELALTRPYVRPYIYMGAVHQLQLALEAVGAAGMVAVTDVPHTYIPYDREMRKVAGVFVDKAVGAKLKALAAENVSLRLKLPARVETIATRNLIGIIPGASDELTVIHSHTDGTNGIEDNGPNAIVDMAQYLARLPKAALPRSVMVMLSAGHFAGGVGIESFLAQHATDGLRDRMAAVVTVEHLGAKEYLPDATGALVATGKFEPSAMYMPKIPALVTASQAFQVNADTAPSVVAAPTNPNGAGTANNNVWAGEGQYFWGQGKIPTINYITGPYYLLNYGADVTTADKVDYDRIHRETVGFTQMILDLSRVPYADLHAAPVK